MLTAAARRERQPSRRQPESWFHRFHESRSRRAREFRAENLRIRHFWFTSTSMHL